MLSSEPEPAARPKPTQLGVSSQLMQNGAEMEGVRHGQWMGDLFCQLQRAARIRQRDPGSRETKDSNRLHPGADAGIVTRIGQGMCPMFSGL